jgi:hypothetical protein
MSIDYEVDSSQRHALEGDRIKRQTAGKYSVLASCQVNMESTNPARAVFAFCTNSAGTSRLVLNVTLASIQLLMRRTDAEGASSFGAAHTVTPGTTATISIYLNYYTGVVSVWMNNTKLSTTIAGWDGPSANTTSAAVYVGANQSGAGYADGKLEDLRVEGFASAEAEAAAIPGGIDAYVAAVYAAAGTDYERARDVSRRGGVWLPLRGVPGVVASTITDFSGEVTGTATGSPPYAANLVSVPDQGGFGVRFNGSTDYLNITGYGSFGNAASSISGWCWCMPTGVATDSRYLFALAQGGATTARYAPYYRFDTGKPGNLVRRLDGDSGAGGATNVACVAGPPLLVAAVSNYTAGTLTVFGITAEGTVLTLATSIAGWDSSPGSATDSPLFHIAQATSGTAKFPGHIANVRLRQNNPLTLPELMAIWNARGANDGVPYDIGFTLRNGAPGMPFVSERCPRSGAVALVGGGAPKYASDNQYLRRPKHGCHR